MTSSLEFATREYLEVAEAFQNLRPNHIVARSQEVADQLLKVRDEYCVAQIRKNGDQVAMFAYIPAHSELAKKIRHRVVHGAGWWASRDHPGSGALLIQRTLAHLESKFLAVGLTEDALGVYRQLGWSLGKLRNFHLCDHLSGDSQWSCNPGKRSSRPSNSELAIGFAPWTSDSKNSLAHQRIFDRYLLRSKQFFEQRFINHPQLDYTVEECSVEGNVVCLMAYRLIPTEYGTILRLIDLLIEPRLNSSELFLILDKLKYRTCASVVDYKMFGEDLAVVEGAMKGPTCSFALPQLVSPVVWQDVTLQFVCTDERLKGYISRADGDQDRAN